MVPVELKAWAVRHHVSLEALAELATVLGAGIDPASSSAAGEANVQSRVRLAAPAHGMRLFRNNVGVLTNQAGTPVRFGLGNESKRVNDRLKSSDLIGWRRFEIQLQHVGSVIAQFVAFECKAAGWAYRGDEHEEAQQRFLALAIADGGHAKFLTGPEGMQ
jgi:hypothetical protein